MPRPQPKKYAYLGDLAKHLPKSIEAHTNDEAAIEFGKFALQAGHAGPWTFLIKAHRSRYTRYSAEIILTWPDETHQTNLNNHFTGIAIWALKVYDSQGNEIGPTTRHSRIDDMNLEPATEAQLAYCRALFRKTKLYYNCLNDDALTEEVKQRTGYNLNDLLKSDAHKIISKLQKELNNQRRT